MTFTSLDSIGKTNLMLDLISQKQRAFVRHFGAPYGAG